MDKNELISSLLSFKDNIGMWKIVLNQITNADFVIGYGFDNNEKLWKVYQKHEKNTKNRHGCPYHKLHIMRNGINNWRG